MLDKSHHRGAAVGLSPRVCNSAECFQFGTEVWQWTGVTNVVR